MKASEAAKSADTGTYCGVVKWRDWRPDGSWSERYTTDCYAVVDADDETCPWCERPLEPGKAHLVSTPPRDALVVEFYECDVCGICFGPASPTYPDLCPYCGTSVENRRKEVRP